MKSNTLLWAAIIIVALLSSWLIIDLNQKVENMQYVIEASVHIDDKQTEALQQITQNLQDIIQILHEHDDLIYQDENISYEQ
jgi:hypothetical protein